jgi:hypothetical protein
MMYWPLLLVLLFLSPLQTADDLEKAVTAYWEHLSRRDKISALEYVHPDSKNVFVNRKDTPFRSWKLEGIAPAENGQAVVTISIERLVLETMTYLSVKFRETWVYEGESWKIKLDTSASPPLVAAREASRKNPAPVESGVIKVLPAAVTIPFLAPNQEGAVALHNGFPDTVEILKLEYDEERFETVTLPDAVAPESTALVKIRYKGEETGKNLKSEMVLLVKHAGREQNFIIPITYNHLSSAARVLLGLTPEQAEELKRGDKVRPALKVPQVDESGQLPKEGSDSEQSPE